MFNLTPNHKNTKIITPYYSSQNKKGGFAQCTGSINTKFVAIPTNNPNRYRVVKVLNKKTFSDFGVACSQFDYKQVSYVAARNAEGKFIIESI